MSKRYTSTKRFFISAMGIIALGTISWAAAAGGIANPRNPNDWPPNDPERPSPPRVEPGVSISDPPSDAIVLFDGDNLDHWRMEDGSDAAWRLEDGVMIADGGNLWTRDAFGDCQLHIEWMTSPNEDVGTNSGVFLSARYEVQVIDSSRDQYAPDQRAGGIYAQYPPLVNVTRPRGEWQTFQIIFRRPRFNEDGTLLSPATMTVFHNGVLVQYNETLTGPTVLTGPRGQRSRPPYSAHGRAPIMLQFHSGPVRFRNIWIRDLE